MAKHRKRFRFACGHLGKGKYCHRCDQADTLASKAATLSQSKDKKIQEQYQQLKLEAARLREVPRGPTTFPTIAAA